jgi:flavin reductase (DIM6/NTAB) family NADH-FMN oxidoreductase RutF
MTTMEGLEGLEGMAALEGMEGLTSDLGELKRAFAAFPSGVAALSARVDGDPTVMIVSSFTVGVSAEPPLVSFAVQHSSTTWPTLPRAGARSVRPGPGTRRPGPATRVPRQGGPVRRRRHGGSGIRAIFLQGAPVWLECAVEHHYPAGDHDIIVLRVLALMAYDDRHPLVWHQRTFKMLAD